MPGWMSEGAAEFVAFEAMVNSGLTNRSAAQRDLLGGAISNGAMDHRLAAFAQSRWPAWPGELGALALAGLLDHTGTGPESILDYTRLVGQTGSHERAFQAVWGLSTEEFYDLVEPWRRRVGSNINAQPLWSR